MSRLLRRKKKPQGSQALQEGDNQNKDYSRTARRGWFGRRNRHSTNKPVGLTPVVTPRPHQHLSDDGDDHMTEREQKQEPTETTLHEEKAPSVPGAEHFPPGIFLGRYEFVRYLGHGSYGHVCEGLDVESGDKVAIKKIGHIFDNDIDAKRLLRELRILRLLRHHEAIVDLRDIIPPTDPNTFDAVVLIFEYVDTDLSKLIASDQYFTSLHVQYMLYQILLGLKYMHTGNIAHRDLKPANILVNEDCTLKICDFGLARGITENVATPHAQSEEALTQPPASKRARNKQLKKKPKREVTKHVVTRWYRAPEVILLQQQRETLTAVDMWSIGCIMAELLQMKRDNEPNPRERKPLFPGTSCFPLSARDPFAYADRMDQLNVIFDVIGTPSAADTALLTDQKARKYLRSLPQRNPVNLRHRFRGSTEEAIDLMNLLITFNPNDRISVDEALQHPYLSRVRDLDAERQHAPAQFEFEDVSITIHQLRALVVDEIGEYNPEWMEELRGGTTDDNIDNETISVDDENETTINSDEKTDE